MSKLQGYLKLLFLLGVCFVHGEGQALNGHINPAWVESGRELLASQGFRLGQQNYVRSYLNSRNGVQDFASIQPSLFYLDSAGKLRPVYIESGVPSSLTRVTNYRSQFGANGVTGRPELYQQEPYFN